MNDIKSSKMSSVMFDLLKINFGKTAAWRKMEGDLALMCSDLTEPSDDTKIDVLVKGLEGISEYLKTNGMTDDEVAFISENIDRYKNTKQISLYTEEDVSLDPEVIDKYANLSIGKEGVIAIHMPYNYQQLKKLTNGVFQKTGQVKFYISREKIVYGKIVAEIYEFPVKVPIATLIESTKENEVGKFDREVVMFGEKCDLRLNRKIKEMGVPLYVYRFITENSQELILLSTEQCNIGDYIVTGVVTQCDDYRMLTDSAKLPTKLPYMFAQQVMNRVIRFKDHKELKSKLEQLGLDNKLLFDFPFMVKKGSKNFILKHPDWYKWFVWSWLTHEEKGMFNKYPMHILQMGPKHSGKSLELNTLHANSREARSIFSGSSSTLKNLIPSFKSNPAKLGYLAESNRFAFCDEFLRCIFNTRTNGQDEQREESVALMNDLLEHQKREAGSGISKVNVNMTARIFATTNPIRGINTVEDMIDKMENSFLCRIMIYLQTDDHTQLIRKARDSELQIVEFNLNPNDWIAILDYLHTFSAKYDSKILEDIYAEVPPILSEKLAGHYDARHMHHLECLADGLIKARCLVERDMKFEATQEDYDRIKMVWNKLIASWIQPNAIGKMPVEKRIFYMPENAQWLYWEIDKEHRILTQKEVKDIGFRKLSPNDYYTALGILISNGIVIEEDNELRPHYIGAVAQKSLKKC